MSVKTTQYQRPGARALIAALALLVLLGAGCSEKETTAPEERRRKEATQPMVASEAAPPAEAPEPAATAPAVEEPAADAPADPGRRRGRGADLQVILPGLPRGRGRGCTESG